MEKNMKNIIHLSCLILLLFTCNNIIGTNGITKNNSLYYVHKAIFPSVDTTEELLPIVDKKVVILEASSRLRTLLQKKEERAKEQEEIDRQDYNEINNILIGYVNELKISILDNNGNPTGICDTKGWKKDEVIKEEIAREITIVTRRLPLLIRPNTAFNENESDIGLCCTRGLKKNQATTKQKKNIQENHPNPKLDEHDNHIGIFDTNYWKKNKAKKEQVEIIQKNLILPNKRKQN